MQLARYDKILALKTATGRVVGFHAHNLQVAELDEQVWRALQNPESVASDVREEIALWNQEVDTNVTDGNVAQKIRSLTINVTQTCNLKCVYCAAGGDGTYGSKTAKIDVSLAVKQIDMFLEKLGHDDSFNINFLGGEPLIWPQAIEAIVRHVTLKTAGSNMKVHYEMTTNGTLVTAAIAQQLAKMKCNVTVSFDGPALINDQVRPTRGGTASSARTLKGIDELFKVREQLGSLNVHAVFGAHNIEVLKSYEHLREWNWNTINLTYAAGPEDEIYSPVFTSQMGLVAELAFAKGGEKELRRISQFDHFFRTLDGQQRIHNYCGAGKSLLQVDTEGRFYVCNWFVNDEKEEVGRGLELDQDKLKKYAASLIELNNCGSCWAKHMCGGGCMFVHRARTGDKHKTDPEFCNRTRGLIAKGIDYYEQARREKVEGE